MAEIETRDPKVLTEGPMAGWIGWALGHDPFEDLAGPYGFKTGEDGAVRVGMKVERRHLNGVGMMHGGAIMTFIDYALFAIAAAQKALEGTHAVTLTCNTEFVGGALPGKMLEATGEVVRNARSVVFVQGRVTQEGQPVAMFSATLKKTKPRA